MIYNDAAQGGTYRSIFTDGQVWSGQHFIAGGKVPNICLVVMEWLFGDSDVDG